MQIVSYIQRTFFLYIFILFSVERNRHQRGVSDRRDSVRGGRIRPGPAEVSKNGQPCPDGQQGQGTYTAKGATGRGFRGNVLFTMSCISTVGFHVSIDSLMSEKIHFVYFGDFRLHVYFGDFRLRRITSLQDSWRQI